MLPNLLMPGLIFVKHGKSGQFTPMTSAVLGICYVVVVHEQV